MFYEQVILSFIRKYNNPKKNKTELNTTNNLQNNQQSEFNTYKPVFFNIYISQDK
ncbi:hypothetical protein VCRA2110O318_130021 [Vibrio crassostreae]|nr:hypothetical protein VCRA2117O328_140021 [Vibrio crassostreae]CAK2264517.1 hypothetical protein VCRA2110O318_130021 [Vibrio crassostreae]CAK2540180.1 hypothetical protein VCRA2110O319_80173 [Vibrio crassostreae]CAK2641027.1 hypothetical protein VCRA217O317_140105 [Vibrio crassostreae]